MNTDADEQVKVTENEPPQVTQPETPDGVKDTFDELAESYLGQIIAKCNDNPETIGVVVIHNKDFDDGPLIFINGDHYQVAKILAALLRQLKKKIMEDLS